jgi:transposase
MLNSIYADLQKTFLVVSISANNILSKASQWWHFLEHPDIPPDNNLSERSLWLAVTKRKVCGGSRSLDGFAATAILLTVIQTCRSQGRSAWEFFQQALMSTTNSDLSMPSLIPDSST